ncbi:MAG: 50S ribosomal protein L2 [Candidatus Lokiarchaeota archaeon]|nr:50S ribosomal protein L2 [Candidatus Lokiarchaeota archaeon]
MGKRILVQRRGRGTPNWQSPTHKRRGKVKYRYFKKGSEDTTAKIRDLIHDPGRGAPLAQILYEDGKKGLYLPPEGVFVGDTIHIGDKIKIKVGNILKLRNVPEGTRIYNIEGEPMDGGKFVRGSGTFGTVVSKDEKFANVKLPSQKSRKFLLDCRCTVGLVAGGGRTEKPFLKAGAKYHWMKTKHSVWPRTSGVAMTAASHPFGGGGHKSPHKPTTIGRNAPPGRKVGLIAARRTGLLRGRRIKQEQKK